MMLRPGTNDDGRPRSSAYALPVPVASSRPAMAGFVRLASASCEKTPTGSTTCSTPAPAAIAAAHSSSMRWRWP